jgi:hypothetical protein
MTALCYVLQPSEVMIMMDTLTTTIDKKPFNYASKIFPLPHLNGIICATGSIGLIIDWFSIIQKNVIAKNISYLNTIASEQLRKIYEQYNEVGDSTIYHFGYNEVKEIFQGFAFRSKNNFEIEKLVYSIGIKPSDGDIISYASNKIEINGMFNGIIDTIRKQKEIQDIKPNELNKIKIGGGIHCLIINKDTQIMWQCYTFPDYEEIFNEMLYNLTR